jgi:hypothetical protein
MKLFKIIKYLTFLLIYTMSDKLRIHIKGEGQYSKLCKKIKAEPNSPFSYCSKTKKTSDKIRQKNSIISRCLKYINGEMHVFLYEPPFNDLFLDIGKHGLGCSKFYTEVELVYFNPKDDRIPGLQDLALLNTQFFGTEKGKYDFELLPEYSGFVDGLPDSLKSDLTVRYNIATVALETLIARDLIDIPMETFLQLLNSYDSKYNVYKHGQQDCELSLKTIPKETRDMNYLYAFFDYFEARRYRRLTHLNKHAEKCFTNAIKFNKSDIFKQEEKEVGKMFQEVNESAVIKEGKKKKVENIPVKVMKRFLKK